MNILRILLILVIFLFFRISFSQENVSTSNELSDLLDYKGSPETPYDRTPLVYSDQGTWFGFNLPSEPVNTIGFSGPFLMTQENGVWLSSKFFSLDLRETETGNKLNLSNFSFSQSSYLSHLQQTYSSPNYKIDHKIFFPTPHSAIVTTKISNFTSKDLQLEPILSGSVFLTGITLSDVENELQIHSSQSTAVGYLKPLEGSWIDLNIDSDSSYTAAFPPFKIRSGASKEFSYSISFLFPEDDKNQEFKFICSRPPSELMKEKIRLKDNSLNAVFAELAPSYQQSIYRELVAKCVLTLQNNWRSPAGELKHSGLFPSYHIKWFHGFWAWDSWKHSSALVLFDPDLAKDQIRAMYDYMGEDGFIADCIFRDTTIEKHNFRNTKPPLSAWAVWNIFEHDKDRDFLEEMFYKLVTQHISTEIMTGTVYVNMALLMVL